MKEIQEESQKFLGELEELFQQLLKEFLEEFVVVFNRNERRDHIELVSLALAEAYNRAWMPRVVQHLADWGVSGHRLDFIKHYFTNRKSQVMQPSIETHPRRNWSTPGLGNCSVLDSNE